MTGSRTSSALNTHSVDRVLPEFQHPKIGDMIHLSKNSMRTELVEPERVLATRSQDGNWVWTFVLYEDDGQTRLVSRNRFGLPTRSSRLSLLPMESGSLVMEGKMLHGIKQRPNDSPPIDAILNAIVSP